MIRVADLQVSSGFAARDALCAAFDAAQHSISAEFYRLNDPRVIASLNAAATRGVEVEIELEGAPDRYHHAPGRQVAALAVEDSVAASVGTLSSRVHVSISLDPLVLLHAKAALVDGRQALLATANQTVSGFYSPGGVVISDTNAGDVGALSGALHQKDAERGEHFISGPGPRLRQGLARLFTSENDLRIAVEDLSDPEIVRDLEERRALGHRDRILINACQKVSQTQARVIRELEAADIAVRSFPRRYMHEKYVDADSELYVGSANLTHNGLDESREVSVIAPPQNFADGATSLRATFEAHWEKAQPVSLKGCVVQDLGKAA